MQNAVTLGQAIPGTDPKITAYVMLVSMLKNDVSKNYAENLQKRNSNAEIMLSDC